MGVSVGVGVGDYLECSVFVAGHCYLAIGAALEAAHLELVLLEPQPAPELQEGQRPQAHLLLGIQVHLATPSSTSD